MKSIGAHFRKIEQAHPEWGNYVVLIEAVRGKKFSRKAIRLFFNEFIDSEDYDRADVMKLISQLHLASNITEDGQFGIKIQFRDVLNALDESDTTSRELVG